MRYLQKSTTSDEGVKKGSNHLILGKSLDIHISLEGCEACDQKKGREVHVATIGKAPDEKTLSPGYSDVVVNSSWVNQL
jgi:hypothetical protein